MSKLDKRAEALLAEMRKANAILEGSRQPGQEDGGRKAAAIDGQKKIAADLTANDQNKEREARKAARKDMKAQLDELTALMSQNRRPSKAAAVGGVQPGLPHVDAGSLFKTTAATTTGAFKAILRDPDNYDPGTFLSAVLDAVGLGYDMHYDPFLGQQGKARLAAMGSGRGDVPVTSTAGYAVGHIAEKGANPDFSGKATLGTTGATGGYVLPNNLVDSVVKPSTQAAVYQKLVTVINGVAVRGVDQPYRTSAAQRAVFVDWGQTKTNVNEAYGTYSANLGTLAIIYDIGKQYARFSGGAAEQDVMDEITRGMILGENYYIAVGAGTGTVGTGDPTAGVYTQLLASGLYTTPFSGASSSTPIGSLAEALTQGSQALSTRNRAATAWVADAVTYWTAIGQASAYTFINTPSVGPTGFRVNPAGGLEYWGVPFYYDANLDSNSGTTKIVIGGQWDMLKLYRGMEFRIDTTDIAGDRWDKNLIGFRGEQEIGFHAGTAVAVGAMQLITAAIP